MPFGSSGRTMTKIGKMGERRPGGRSRPARISDQVWEFNDHAARGLAHWCSLIGNLKGSTPMTCPRWAILALIVGMTAGGAAQPGSSNQVTMTGRVVDAACYMLHPPAATIASHRDRGAACLARGVPLAIAADDG